MSLILLPNLLDTSLKGTTAFSKEVIEVLSTIDGLIAESEKEGRRYLKRFLLKKKPHEIPIALLNEHTKPDLLNFLLEPLVEGERWGVVSDGGLPCLADPGSALVFLANQLKIPVIAYPGPSSIFLGLMLSGLPAQRFCFHGYPAKDIEKRQLELCRWQEESRKENSTQIFIEAPYRNHSLFQFCLSTLSSKTQFCIATNLTSPTQMVKTQSIREWKTFDSSQLQDNPTIFIFNSFK